MPVNKLALLRYKIIDECLQNRFRRWTLEDLINAVSDGLYEYEGIQNGVSKRTIQLDIQNMRSDKLGYHAPIIVQERKYYTYEDKDFSITNTPLTGHDLEKLNEVVGMLKQFKGFGYFSDLAAIVTRIEDKVLKQKNQGVSYIEFDKNEHLKGLEYLDPLHRAIQKKETLLVHYQSFKAKTIGEFYFYPYLLKEYNNRWFLFGRNAKHKYAGLIALDRIVQLTLSPTTPFQETEDLEVHTYFNDLIGVSKTPKQRPITIVFRITKSQMPYLITKPLHPSQSIQKEEEEHILFTIQVIWNYELEREIIGMGEVIEVISPRRLRHKIKRRLQDTLKLYEE